MGSDLAGVVASVEPTCKRLRVGDSVWGDIGAIVRARTDNATGKENGAYAQFAVALESQLGVMPQNIKFEEAASLPKVALTSVKALSRYGGAPYADRNVSVVILGGSGGTGSTGIQLAKAFGAKKIITTTSSSNFDFVKRLGADVVIDYHSQNWWDVLLDGSVDVIYDTVGQHGTGDRAMAKLTAGGHYVTIVGAVPEHPRTDVSSTMFINSATNLENVDLLDKLREFVETDRLRSRTLKVYPLKGILDAFAESAGGHTVGKLVIAMPDASADCSKDSSRGDIACDNSLEV
jgi:NADPH:quinone reductase-like Zn-dependent oxidoreductase